MREVDGWIESAGGFGGDLECVKGKRKRRSGVKTWGGSEALNEGYLDFSRVDTSLLLTEKIGELFSYSLLSLRVL